MDSVAREARHARRSTRSASEGFGSIGVSGSCTAKAKCRDDGARSSARIDVSLMATFSRFISNEETNKGGWRQKERERERKREHFSRLNMRKDTQALASLIVLFVLIVSSLLLVSSRTAAADSEPDYSLVLHFISLEAATRQLTSGNPVSGSRLPLASTRVPSLLHHW